MQSMEVDARYQSQRFGWEKLWSWSGGWIDQRYHRINQMDIIMMANQTPQEVSRGSYLATKSSSLDARTKSNDTRKV